MDARGLYGEVTVRLSELSALDDVSELLQWDQEVVMPPGAAAARARQTATLAVIRHDKAVDPVLGEALERLEEHPELDALQRANVREALREHRRETRVPPDLVRRWTEATVKAHGRWVSAREAADFSGFAPALEELVDLAREKAAAIDPDAAPYDVMIEAFEPGTTMARLDPVFEVLKGFLVPFVERIREAGARPPAPWTATRVPAERQEAVARRFIGALGFSFDRGRVDTAVHPFCGGGGLTDVRITTRYRTDAFLGSLLAALHETGHALYEQGRDVELADQPVSKARSMGIHESQSLLWEQHVGRSAAFWRHHLAWLREDYPFLRDVGLDEFVFALNRVDFDNPIRVDADELTYSLHVILRYEIERDLLAGSLQVADLPEAWAEKMQRYLRLTPADDAAGVLQDIHWSMGYFGYFPSYTLGALYAAQIFDAAARALGDLPALLAAGDLAPLRAWLRANIHAVGSRLGTDELCRAATGASLDPTHFIAYAREKFSGLYGLSGGAD